MHREQAPQLEELAFAFDGVGGVGGLGEQLPDPAGRETARQAGYVLTLPAMGAGYIEVGTLCRQGR